MRIIAGQRRGHKFEGPADRHTRPTSDLVRESIFNILGDRIEDCIVYDLFAGTGALGLEALSRGASRAVFVEIDRETASLIRRNLATLRYQDRAAVVTGDAYRWLRNFTPLDDTPVVFFLDPPYREFQNHPKRFATALAELIGRLPDGSTLVVEYPDKLETEVLPDPELWDLRRYGGTRVAIRTIGEVESSLEPTN